MYCSEHCSSPTQASVLNNKACLHAFTFPYEINMIVLSLILLQYKPSFFFLKWRLHQINPALCATKNKLPERQKTKWLPGLITQQALFPPVRRSRVITGKPLTEIMALCSQGPCSNGMPGISNLHNKVESTWRLNSYQCSPLLAPLINWNSIRCKVVEIVHSTVCGVRS